MRHPAWPGPRVALARQADPLAVMDALGDLDSSVLSTEVERGAVAGGVADHARDRERNTVLVTHLRDGSPLHLDRE
jgi:hypothetical protein